MEVTNVGSPEEQKAFGQRNPKFLEALPNLTMAFEEILNRKLTESERDLPGTLLFFMGHEIVDDFMEGVVLCANAEGRGAEKLLRTMFEHVVTLRYLAAHPDLAQRYYDYYWIDQYKLLMHIDKEDVAKLDQEKVNEVKKRREELKGNYMMKCQACGAERPSPSWSPLDLVAMAKEVGLGALVVRAYYIPLQHAHSKVSGMLQKLTVREDGAISPKERLDPERADQVMAHMHGLVVEALETHVKYFNLDRSRLQEIVIAFKAAWNAPASTPET